MKVLIIRFSSIGDIVMTTPVIRCVHQQLDAEIYVATKKAFSSIFQHNQYVKNVISLDGNWKSFMSELKKEKYDLIIDLHNNLRSKRLSKGLRMKARKIDKLSFQKTLLIRTGINHLPEVHFSERGLETVIDLGVQNDFEGMDFFIPEEINVSVKKMISPLIQDLGLVEDKFVTLALATAHFTKNIPEATIGEIIENSSLPVVLLGGPAEQELGNRLAKKYYSKSVNMAGNVSIMESAALVNASVYLVAGDTGLLHIAAALKKPTLSIWGATIPEYGVFPYYGKYDVPHFIHENKMSCRPCSKHGTSKCPKKHFDCMNKHDVESIIEHMKVLN